jgi:MFS family permease
MTCHCRQRSRRFRNQDRQQLSASSFTKVFCSSGIVLSNGFRRRYHYHNHQSRQQFSSSSSSGVFSKDAATQPVDTPTRHRWWAVPPANLVHLSIGGVYVYSMWTPALHQAVGVVAPAATDWTVGQLLPVFSAAAISLGLTTHFLGEWVERVGPRHAGAVGSLCWGTGLLTTAFGAYMHQLPLVYLGYSAIGGVGWGLMYLCPVTSVMKWFPDRRGLATGIALSAFGMGAAVAPALIHAALDFFSDAPEYIGPLAREVAVTAASSTASQGFVELTTLPDGSQMVAESSSIGLPGQKVVVATESDLTKLPWIDTGPGAYVLGSGDTGVAKAFATMGIGYGAMGLLGSRFMILPHPQWEPRVKDKDVTDSSSQETITISDDTLSDDNNQNEATKTNTNNNIGLPAAYVVSSTKQYPLLWLSVFGNATGGLALLSSSKLMITDIWAGVAPSIVTASFATGYVSTLGLGMAAGRFGWSFLSDYIGRQNTYAIFGLGIPIVGLSPYLSHAAAASVAATTTTALVDPSASSNHAVLPFLMAFYGGSVLAITFYGGIFSTLPAYIADLFGQKHAGAIHGKLLTAWAGSAVVGPMGLAYLRSRAVDRSIDDLLSKVDDGHTFKQFFGCSLEDAETIQRLIDSKTITIGRLLEILPESTVDPTPFIYDSTCYAAACLMGISFLSNLAIKPLDFVKISHRLETEKETKI